jgi:hypothetical protein
LQLTFQMFLVLVQLIGIKVYLLVMFVLLEVFELEACLVLQIKK